MEEAEEKEKEAKELGDSVCGFIVKFPKCCDALKERERKRRGGEERRKEGGRGIEMGRRKGEYQKEKVICRVESKSKNQRNQDQTKLNQKNNTKTTQKLNQT